ncbi:MAG: shikimate dehydrogenase, partial [Alphaproteobacteria bacterium]|nr:shikimate dehydrogenase [Alphaproteobacteria bacterium]
VRPENLETALRALPRLAIAGCNLTLPHKEAALAVMDEVDPMARRIGAVNTVVVDAEGRLNGSNTDGFGFVAALEEDAAGWRVDTGPAVVLGAGGAARAVIAALLERGTPEIRIVNRTLERAERLGRELERKRCSAVSWAAAADRLAEAALLVNTTSLGMEGQPPLALDLGCLPTEAVVNDIVYTPLETDLLAAARRRGNRVVDGLGMLLHQARPGFEAWFGTAPAVTAALRAHILADIQG